jgi:co-chaperonin GroES (HSP10)
MTNSSEIPELKTEQIRPEHIDKFHGARYLVEEVEISQFVGNIRLIHENPEVAQYWSSGYVRKVGNGQDGDKNHKMVFAEGDLVFFERLTGREMQLSGKKYRVIPQTSVFGNFEVNVRG